MTIVRIPRPDDPEGQALWDEAKRTIEERRTLVWEAIRKALAEHDWAPQVCTREIGCPVCGVPAGERCLSDRPLHLERWDAWRK